MPKFSSIDQFFEKHGMLLLDGGLATELEKMGFDLSSHLWSAQILDSDPDAIRKVHLSYLNAGANCIISASYQASIPGFISNGFSKKKAKTLLERSVALANEACDEYIEISGNALRPLVAASIGPYGAYLANGAEYNGNYNITKSKLRSFHESRWEILLNTSINLFACETIPSFEEAEVLLDILRQTPEKFAWISFSCQDNERISDGTLIRECATLFKDCDQLVAFGINCTAPRYITSLIEQVQLGLPNKPVVVYPNSGNTYNGEGRTWIGKQNTVNFAVMACDWSRSGAKIIGGCCQTGPEHIRAMRDTLLNHGLYRT